MDLGMDGWVAAVVGGSVGIGAATVEVLAEEGCDVVITYNSSAQAAEDLASRVRASGRRAWPVPLDLRSPESVRTAAAAVADLTGGLDTVVLNAGLNVVTPVADVSAQEWDDVLSVNLRGPFLALQSLAPLLRPGGSVVTVASVAAHTGNARHAHYAAAKAGLVNLSMSMARELAPRVRVNCVAPGITLTAMGVETVAGLPEDYAGTRLLLERYATPRRVGQTIAFVASPVAEFMTGATVDVNSGRHLR